MARPIITEICRKIIPLGGMVVVKGENFVEGSTEVRIAISRYRAEQPLAPGIIGDGGGWGMGGGHSIGWADRVVPGDPDRLFFTLPVEEGFLTHDDTWETSTGVEIHDWSILQVILDVPGEGRYGPFPGFPSGLQTVPESRFHDPPGVDRIPLWELEDILLLMINEIRGWNDAGPLTMNSALRDVARAHAQLLNDEWGYSYWVDHTCTGWRSNTGSPGA